MAEPSTDPDRGKSRNGRAVLLAVLLVAAVGSAAWWWTHRHQIHTDNAFIQADIVQISPKLSGTVSRVPVLENQSVQAGDLLLSIDAADYDVRVARARANLAAARARLQSAEADLALTREQSGAGIAQAQAALRAAQAEAERDARDAARYRELYAKDEVARQRVDRAETAAEAARQQVEQARAALRQAQTAPQQISVREAQVETAQAEVAQAEAALHEAELQRSYCDIRAPSAGRVTKKNVQLGQEVVPGRPLLAIVSDEPWVVANLKETQLTRVRPGQPVRFAIDAYPGYEFHGHVDSIQSGTGAAFSLLPAENATGNYVKVVQRVPVKLVFDARPDIAHRLVPGMSVVPTIDVSDLGTDRHG